MKERLKPILTWFNAKKDYFGIVFTIAMVVGGYLLGVPFIQILGVVIFTVIGYAVTHILQKMELIHVLVNSRLSLALVKIDGLEAKALRNLELIQKLQLDLATSKAETEAAEEKSVKVADAAAVLVEVGTGKLQST